jgi:hypothetical protein
MMRKLKLMTDYNCFPLWETVKDRLENIDPNSLKISEELKNSLYRWAEAFDATLNQDYPPDSGFATEEEVEKFEQEGRRIFNELKEQLKDEFVFSYYSQKDSKLYNS